MSRTHIKLLNLCRDWLRSFLPHCLQKIDRVTFGLLSKEDYERALAADPHMPRTRAKLGIPFVGKDVPSRSSEFAHPDIIIGLTILGYRYEGLRWTDFVDIIESLRATLTKETGPFNERKSSRLYNRWVKEAGGRIRGAPKYVVDEKDEDKNANDLADAVVSGEGPKTPRLQLDSDDKAKKGEAGRKEEAEEWRWLLKRSNEEQMNQLFNLLRKLPDIIHWYLLEMIFPLYMRHPNIKLSVCGQELGGEILFRRRMGFSGTFCQWSWVAVATKRGQTA